MDEEIALLRTRIASLAKVSDPSALELSPIAGGRGQGEGSPGSAAQRRDPSPHAPAEPPALRMLETMSALIRTQHLLGNGTDDIGDTIADFNKRFLEPHRKQTQAAG